MPVAERMYARALFEAAQEQGSVAGVRGELGALATAIGESHELSAFLGNPQLDPGAKADVLGEITTDADPLVHNFVRLVATKGRAGSLQAIAAAARLQIRGPGWEWARGSLPIAGGPVYGRAYAQAVAGCAWLTPQAVPEGYVHSYWTYVLKLAPEKGITWYEFRHKYVELGGDGIYAAWLLTYNEPTFRGQRFAPQQWQHFEAGLCPVAETLQPRLLQFKTNYFDADRADHAAEVLAKTIAYFS